MVTLTPPTLKWLKIFFWDRIFHNWFTILLFIVCIIIFLIWKFNGGSILNSRGNRIQSGRLI